MTLQNHRVDGTGTQQRVLWVPQLGRDGVLLIFIFLNLFIIYLAEPGLGCSSLIFVAACKIF